MKQNKPKNPFEELQNKLKGTLSDKGNETRLVYSSDGAHLKLCKKCHEDPCICADSKANAVDVIPEKTTLKMRLEKNARGGKTVTVVFDLPNNQTYFEDLAKKLKNHCGSGGTFKNDQKAQIEIQGDHKDKVEAYLVKMGFKVKRSGA